VEFRILGPIEITGEHGPIKLHRGKEQALLAYMLLHANQVIPSDRLIDELWGGRPPTTAGKILQNAVSQLRKALGDGRLETRTPGYVFHLGNDELDVDRFEQLANEGRHGEALALWRGTPLLELREERFADEARRALEERRLGVIEDRIDADLAAGKHAALIPELEQLVAAEPLRERLHGQLMRALYASGRQSDALEAYRRARRALSEELGLEPGPQLQELERQILNQDPALLTTAAPQAHPARPRRRRWFAVALGVLVLLAAAITGIVLATGDGSQRLLATKDTLAVVDPERGRVVGVVPIGSTPRGVARGGSSIWTANAGDGTVTEVDPATLKVVRTVGLGAAATDLVEAGDQMWVATGPDDTVMRLDVRSGGLLGTIPLSHDASANAYGIAADGDALWVGSGNDLDKLDASTHTVSRHVRGTQGINDIALDDRSIWLATSAEKVIRLSKGDLRRTAETSFGVTVLGLAVGNGSVWVAGGAPPHLPQSAIWQLDALAARVTHTTVLPGSGAFGPTVAVAYGENAVWAASFDDGSLIRIDPDSGEIVSRIHVGGNPSAVTVAFGRVWVTVS